jgi:hypothetical protein
MILNGLVVVTLLSLVLTAVLLVVCWNREGTITLLRLQLQNADASASADRREAFDTRTRFLSEISGLRETHAKEMSEQRDRLCKETASLTERQRKQIVLLVKHVNHWQNAAYELGYPREEPTEDNRCVVNMHINAPDADSFRRARFPGIPKI